MRTRDDVFHLAIPAADLDEAYAFYVTGLGCKLARRYADRITLDFFGDQVVCHLHEVVDEEPQLYPRHFGVTFRARQDWERLLRLARAPG
jgi:extradiol dioxygenase family protein